MKVRRTTLLLFFLPVLLLALLSALINYWSLQSLKQQREHSNAVQAEDISLLNEAAHLSADMSEIHLHVSDALDGAVAGKLDEAQLYRIHSGVVNRLAALGKRTAALSQSALVNELSHESAQALERDFEGYRNFVIMATDIIAIDPATARRYIAEAQRRFISFSEHAYRISSLLAEHTSRASAEAELAFRGFFNRVLLFGIAGMAGMLLLSLLSARLLGRKIVTVSDALGMLTEGSATAKAAALAPLPAIERMRDSSKDEFRAMAGAVLAFRDALVERGEAEQELRASKEQLRMALDQLAQSHAGLEHKVQERTRELDKKAQMIEQVSDAIILTDMDRNIRECNAGAAKMLGYSTEELRRLAIRDVYLEEDWDSKGLRIPEELMTREVLEISPRYVRKSGEIISVHAVVKLLRGENGEPQGVISYIVDMTARLAMEERLALSQKIAHFGLWDWNLQTDGLAWTDEIYRMFGLQPQQFAVTYPAFAERIHPDDREAVASAVQQAVESGKPYEIEHRIVRPDGEVRDVLERGQVYRDKQGRPIRMVGVVHDMTERKRASEDLELYRVMIEKSGDPIFLIDDDDNCRMIYVNEAAVRHFGVPREEILSWRIPDWDPNFSDDRLPAHVAAIKNGRNLFIESAHRVRRGAESVLVPVEISLNLVMYKGHMCHFGYFRNITERKRFERELAHAKEQAEAASEAKGNFLANMSHEIRTPMNAIIGFSQLCLQTRLEPVQRDYLEKVNQSANSLLGIINDILDFSKIESGKLEIEETSFHLDSVLENVAATLCIRAEEKGLELLIDKSMEIPHTLLGDALRLTQVLNNLAGNAVKFTHAGEVMIQIREVARSDRQITLRFTVSDTGIGMNEEQISRLFESFSQADASISRRYGGTGLGLAISKRLVELMNGRIWAESAPGQGSRFMFEIPFVCAGEEGQRTLPGLGKLKVLVVDDNDSARNLALACLKSFGAQAAGVSSGQEAEAAVRQADAERQPFTEVLLDWGLPDMDSLELARRIRQLLPPERNPRIIYLAGHACRHAPGKTAASQWLDEVLEKPVFAARLYDTLVSNPARRVSLPGKMVQADASAGLAGLHVLLVEDNEVNRQLATTLLQRVGVKVSSAADGLEALQALQQEKFDVVLMDMQMPNMDGLEATRRIRQNPELAGLPIIAMTANAMFGDRELCLAAGMNDYISKPIRYEALYAAIGRWAQRNALPDQHEQAGLPADETVRVLDPARAMASMGDHEIYLEVLRKFIPNQGAAVQSMQDALEAGDMGQAERLAHTLKGIAATIGALSLAESARQLEEAIRAGDAGSYSHLIAAVAADLAEATAAVSAYLQAHAAGKEARAGGQAQPTLDIAQLGALMEQLVAQLGAFDSTAVDTMRQINRLAEGTPVAARLNRLNRHMGDYDYEGAMKEVQRIREQI